ncbi:outer membrane protein assembly factor BamE [Sinimarinibacterium thermocellulolyticum]|uniref:Outer membrane protein assembly factor BamE n=1 Tax=Sinimarinibacterium thermocellulolyticum TaxID=3170016 RepID=A0ABV2ACY8_9GAMM
MIYKLPTRQGNVIEQKQLDQLQIGMTREQVRYLMGTPLAASPFREDRWDYVGYYKSPRGREAKRVVSLHFDDAGRLVRMEGVERQGTDAALEDPDLKTVLREEQRDAAEQERQAGDNSRETGVILKPE